MLTRGRNLKPNLLQITIIPQSIDPTNRRNTVFHLLLYFTSAPPPAGTQTASGKHTKNYWGSANPPAHKSRAAAHPFAPVGSCAYCNWAPAGCEIGLSNAFTIDDCFIQAVDGDR